MVFLARKNLTVRSEKMLGHSKKKKHYGEVPYVCYSCHFLLLFTAVGGALKRLSYFCFKLLLAALCVPAWEWSKHRPVPMPNALAQWVLTCCPEVNIFLFRDQEE